MTDEDPERLAGQDGLLKDLIEQGRKELASPSQLAAVAAKLGPVLGGGGGGPHGGGGGGATNVPRAASVAAPKAAGMGLANQLAIAALGVATLVTIVHVAMTQGSSPIALTSTPEGPIPGTPSSAEPANSAPDPAEPLLTAPDPSTFLPVVPHHAEGGAPLPPGLAKSGPNPGAELHLLMQAQDALGAEPAKALDLCNEHAKRFSTSKFAQDREVLAISALVALGRTGEAQKRSDAFRATYAGSPLTRRIDQILSPP